MHEHGHVARLVSEIQAHWQERPLRSAAVAVGPRMNPEATRLAFDHLVENTALSSLEVHWTSAEDELTCISCMHAYSGTKLDPCPVCGGSGLVTEEAPELELASVEVAG